VGSFLGRIGPATFQFVHCRIPENAIALGGIVPMDKVELLEKASHPDRSQGFHERLNAGTPQSAGVAVLPSIGSTALRLLCLRVPFCRIFDQGGHSCPRLLPGLKMARV
jgi:hypothetical protein